MDNEIEAFRNEVRRWRGGRRQGARPYTAAMKVKAVRLAVRLRADGLSRAAAAARVGISAATLEGWGEEKAHAGLVPVRVLPEARPSSPFSQSSPVSMVSPRGYRVEVADVASAVALLRELG